MALRHVEILSPDQDAAEPTQRNTFQIWMRRTKTAWLRSIETKSERQLALRGLRYHGEKRVGVRDKDFRRLPPAIQEEIAGTNYYNAPAHLR